MTTWMLLQRTDDLLPALFRQMNNPDFVELFDSTELAVYADSSPLLVTDDSDGTLLEAMRTAPGTWPGLVIESEQPSEAVREHLRQILIVRFEENRKGMLRYWSPKVAERFFSTCTDFNLWLGPISRLAWATSLETGWRELNNPQVACWQPPSSDQRLTLSAEQSQALSKHISNGQES
jgi:hypothetical protein